MATSSQVLPSEENLSKLLDKLISVFGVESVLDGRPLPAHPLQRETFSSAVASLFRPIPGNDFHISPSFSCAPSWEASIRLEHESGGDVTLRLCHADQHPGDPQGTLWAIGRAVTLLRTSWPDATTGLSRRRQLGPELNHPESPWDRIFAWLASKQLNPLREGVFVSDLFLRQGRLCKPLRKRSRGLAVAELPEPEWKPLRTSPLPSSGPPDAQLWSFTGPDPWVISLPVLSAILLLMINPARGDHPIFDCPDRELSWCLDAMHGFCRLKGPEEVDRCLAWSLGTTPDCWMYLHFIFYSFSREALADTSDPRRGSGMQCERRKFSLPIGYNGEIETFGEERVWLGMRTGTSYGDSSAPEHPGTVAFAVNDSHHFVLDGTRGDWHERGLESPEGASGVALFQMVLMTGTDRWAADWTQCLDSIDELLEVRAEDLASNERLEALMTDPDGRLAKKYFLAASLIKIFAKHIDSLPRLLRDMVKTWQRTYPGMNADLLTRFDEATQMKLLDNWHTVIAHAECKRKQLTDRIEKRAAELLRLRDSLFLSKLSKLAMERP
ncbi:hypothetical protein O9K51_04737 [Purpureocillium lavendulum]|uniref:Uncharacterized protein n=1 Tax=Purpureocillium lavendulum TaxID=1247861 RepID=A0AB34FWU8_9HYPO|nr:hypothetical protein O9K51_04737 [Purpureocillium lavendulum]